jgi:DNA polymerase III subunit alpha
MPTSTATTTSRASTGSTSPVTARAWSGCPPAWAARSPRRSRWTTGSSRASSPASTSDILGKGRFFLELQDHGIPEQRRLNEQLLRLAPETGFPLVVTNDLHYVTRDQHEAHDVLLCVGTGNNLDTPGRMRFETQEFYLKTAAEMAGALPRQREALLNTRRIAEMCDLALPLGSCGSRTSQFPRARPSRPGSARSASGPRATLRGHHPGAPEAPGLRAGRDHLDGLRGYFLIVADFVRFAGSRGSPPPAGDPRPGPSSPTRWASRRSTRSTTGSRSSGSSTRTG